MLTQRILSLLNRDYDVTTQSLRRALPDVSKRDFDSALLDLSRRQIVSLSRHHDPHGELTREIAWSLVTRGEDYYCAAILR